MCVIPMGCLRRCSAKSLEYGIPGMGIELSVDEGEVLADKVREATPKWEKVSEDATRFYERVIVIAQRFDTIGTGEVDSA
jgi:hypothetical protein